MSIIGPTDLGIGQLFERVTDAIVVGDPESGNIVLWNPAASRIFGYTADDVVGCPIEILIPPRLRAAHQAGFATFRASGHGRHVDAQLPMELPALTKSEREIWIEMTLSPIERTDGRGYLLAVIRDVTERRRAEDATRAVNADLDRRLAEQAAQLEAATAELRASEERYRLLYTAERQAHAQADEALALRDEFLSIAAHELKTPITSLLLNAQFLLRAFRQDEAVTSGQIGARLRRIETQAHKQAHLVQHLLDVAYIQRGRLRLATDDVDLTVLVAGVVERAREAWPEIPIAYRAPTSLLAHVDPMRLEQTVRNLLDNALVYGRSKQGVEVEVFQPLPTQVAVCVRDFGPGIASEDRAHLFERFFRGRRHTYTAGLGLGLYISKKIVAAHGGTIAAEFPDDGGALFRVTLPTGQPFLDAANGPVYTQETEGEAAP